MPSIWYATTVLLVASLLPFSFFGQKQPNFLAVLASYTIVPLLPTVVLILFVVCGVEVTVSPCRWLSALCPCCHTVAHLGYGSLTPGKF